MCDNITSMKTMVSITEARSMEWEQFAEFAAVNGWSTGSPERMGDTIDLMIDAGIIADGGAN